MRTILALSVLAAVGSASNTFEMYPSFLKENEPSNDWPPIVFPDNFKIFLRVNTLNETSGELQPWRDTTAYQLVDSNGNRELTVANGIMDDGNYGNASFYFDCSTGIVTYKLPESDFCTYHDLNMTINVREMIEKAKDPNSGMTEYLGITNLTYAHHALHHFRITIDTPQGTKYENLYFCTVTL